MTDELRKQGVDVQKVWAGLGSFSARSSDTSLEVLMGDSRLAEVTDNCM